MATTITMKIAFMKILRADGTHRMPATFQSRNSAFQFSVQNIKLKIHRLVFPLVSCGCETWSLAFWKKHRLRVFQNRVLRKIFGSEKDEVTGDT